MAENAIKKYLDNITSQHCDKPRFMGWLAAALDTVDGAKQAAKSIPLHYDVHKAKGTQLDRLGDAVGISRDITDDFLTAKGEKFDDETYRRLLLTKIIKNQWPGTNASIGEIWASTMSGNLAAKYHDNQDMTISVELIGDYAPTDIELALRGYIVPKPMGVSITTSMTTRTHTSMTIRSSCAVVCVGSTVRIATPDRPANGGA